MVNAGSTRGPPMEGAVKRSMSGRFMSGMSGNPKGRPKGSKNKRIKRKQISPVVAALREGATVETARKLLSIMRAEEPGHEGWEAAAASAIVHLAGRWCRQV